MKSRFSKQIDLSACEHKGAPTSNIFLSLLLGQGSICWMIGISIIPILFNLNIQEYYVQLAELNNSSIKVEGTILHSLYARDTFNYGKFSEVVEVHYHYQFDHKNFTGWSYTTDWYYPYGRKLTVLISPNNPKVSRLAVASYLECDESIINILILMLLLFLLGIYRHIYKPANIKDMSTLKTICSVLLFRFSIVALSIYVCFHYSIRDIIFDQFLPISFNAFMLFCLITTAIWHYTSYKKTESNF